MGGLAPLRLLLVAALAALGLALAPAGASAYLPGPPGENDPDCRPTAERPYPLVLVHATFSSEDQYYAHVPLLVARGFCVYTLDYGRNATGDIRDSAATLGAFVDQVLAWTGAERVSIVGHSQGGMMPRWWMRFLGGADKVEDLVGFAAPNHGTDLRYPRADGWGCVACEQQRTGSEFMRQLNDGGDTLSGVDYTTIATRYDEVATPYAAQAIDGPPEQVTNVVLQDACPADASEHLTIIGDPVAWLWALSALERPGPADPALRPCL